MANFFWGHGGKLFFHTTQKNFDIPVSHPVPSICKQIFATKLSKIFCHCTAKDSFATLPQKNFHPNPPKLVPHPIFLPPLNILPLTPLYNLVKFQQFCVVTFPHLKSATKSIKIGSTIHKQPHLNRFGKLLITCHFLTKIFD